MPATLWFSPKTPRRLILRSFAVLVGRAPSKDKRLKMLCTMPLDAETGYPDWLADARDFVMKHGQVVKPAEIIACCNVTMRDEQLFQNTPIEAPKARISHFSVEQMGDSEDPETVLKFQIMAPFSTDLCRWSGQMAGEEFDAIYDLVSGTAAEDEDDEEDAGDDALASEDDGEEDEIKGQQRRRKAKDKKVAAAPSDADIARAKENLTLM